MLISVEPEIKEELNKMARQEGKSANYLVGELITNFIKKKDVGVYIDDLWNRIGKKFKSKGIKTGDISQAVTESRLSRHEGSY
jgi:hypothetical protein